MNRLLTGLATGGLSELWNPQNYADIYKKIAGSDVGQSLGLPGGGGLGDLYNSITGANDVKAAYDQAMNDSRKNAGEIRDFLLNREDKAQGFYKPLQNMFQSAYGTQGIQGPQIPRVPGSKPLGGMFGGR